MSLSNNCYMCNSLIKGKIYKAYDKSLCSSNCIDCLIIKYKFNYNFNLVERKVKPIKKSISSIHIIENNQPQSISDTKYQFVNLIPIVLNEKYNRKSCVYMYTTNYSESVISNIINKFIKKTKKLLY